MCVRVLFVLRYNIIILCIFLCFGHSDLRLMGPGDFFVLDNILYYKWVYKCVREHVASPLLFFYFSVPKPS